jgi:hypothetical protein
MHGVLTDDEVTTRDMHERGTTSNATLRIMIGSLVPLLANSLGTKNEHRSLLSILSTIGGNSCDVGEGPES